MKKGETLLCVCFIALFIFLLSFMIICQPKMPVAVEHFSRAQELGTGIAPAIHWNRLHPLKMSLDRVGASGQSMTLSFTIKNDTDESYTFVSDYVCCFGKEVMYNGSASGSERYCTVVPYSEVIWTVQVDGVLNTMTVCYMDIPNELIFSSWSIDEPLGRHKSEDDT